MKQRSIGIAAMAVVLILLVSGCATIFKGTNQDIRIASAPGNASVIIKTSGGVEVFTGTTPATAKLSKKKEYIVTVKLDGYKETNVMVNQGFEAWTLGNLLCGGVIGLIIDAVDGAMWKLEPDQIMVTLATASLENGQTRLYAVFYGMDADGQLRSTAVPLVHETAPLAVK